MQWGGHSEVSVSDLIHLLSAVTNRLSQNPGGGGVIIIALCLALVPSVRGKGQSFPSPQLSHCLVRSVYIHRLSLCISHGSVGSGRRMKLSGACRVVVQTAPEQAPGKEEFTEKALHQGSSEGRKGGRKRRLGVLNRALQLYGKQFLSGTQRRGGSTPESEASWLMRVTTPPGGKH